MSNIGMSRLFVSLLWYGAGVYFIYIWQLNDLAEMSYTDNLPLELALMDLIRVTLHFVINLCIFWQNQYNQEFSLFSF